MKIVLVDDDASVRENLRTLLGIYVKHAEIVAEADGVKSGVACIKSHHPDVVLLDVEMQDGTGFDLLSIYGELDFKVIFVTGHNGYAIKAFKYSAVDYILKPVDPEELINAIEKAGQGLDQQEQNLKVANLVQNKKEQVQDRKIVLKDAGSVYLVAVHDIVRCESETNYTRFHLVDGRSLVVSKTLKEFDNLLEEQSFFRAHQSHLINLQHFDRFEKRDGGTVHMKDGSVLPVSVRKKDALMAELERL